MCRRPADREAPPSHDDRRALVDADAEELRPVEHRREEPPLPGVAPVLVTLQAQPLARKAFAWSKRCKLDPIVTLSCSPIGGVWRAASRVRKHSHWTILLAPGSARCEEISRGRVCH
jgi:hypothetical protein